MICKRLTATVALLAGLLSSTALSAQDLKLYAFSSGALTLGKGYLVNGAPMANSDLLLSAARWLAREERTTAVAARVPVPPLIALTGRQSNAVFFLVVVAMPLLVVALGCVVWWRRR